MAQNAFGLTSLYDPSIAVDQTALERQMALAAALRKSALTPVETQGRQIGGVAYKTSPWEGVAKALQAYQANSLDSDTDASRLTLAQKQAQAMKAAAAGMFGDGGAAPAPSGLPAGVTPEAMVAGGFPQPPAQAPTQAPANDQVAQLRRAAQAAFLRGDQAGASKLVENLLSLTPDQKNNAAMGIDPRAMGAAQMAKLKKEGLMDVTAGNTVFDPATGKSVFNAPEKIPAGFKRDEGGSLAVEPGWLSAEMQLRNAGATKVQTNVNAFTPASEAAQTELMKSTRTTYDALKQAPVALASIEKAKALIPAAKGFVGPGGEGLLQAAKFLNNRLGMNVNTEGVKSAEELRTRIFFNVMDNLKKMDAQPSELQQKMMQEALGNLGTDPGALPRVLDAFGDAIKGKVELHNREVAGAAQRGVKFPYDPTIKVGQASTQKGLVQNPDGSYNYTP